MKKINFLLIALLVSATTIFAQGGLSYQSIVRNSSGAPAASTTVHLRFNISDIASGTFLYSEIQSLTTDTYGWFNASIGTGTVLSGSFAAINWNSGPKKLSVACAPVSGGFYSDINASTITNIFGNAGSGYWEKNPVFGPNTIFNGSGIENVLISPTPLSAAINRNTLFNVVGEGDKSLATFDTKNTRSGSKAVSIINSGTASTFVRPIGLSIENKPFLDSGIGIDIKAGETGIVIDAGLNGIIVNSSNLGAAGNFKGGTGILASGENSGVTASAFYGAHDVSAINGSYIGQGNFNGIGVYGTSLPTNAAVPYGRGFGIGGKFVGANKGVIVETQINPSSTFYKDFRTYNKTYGDERMDMGGLFKTHGSVGLMAVATDVHETDKVEFISIGVVGRANANNASFTNIGVYGEGEAGGIRIGVYGKSSSDNDDLVIGVKGESQGRSSIGGSFKASEGIHVDAINVGAHITSENTGLDVSSTGNVLSGYHATNPQLSILNGAPGGTALELADGYLKVNQTSNNRTAFVHTVANDNLDSYQTYLDYPAMSETDIILITHAFNTSIIKSPVGVRWLPSKSAWVIYTEDQSAMPIKEKFNVLIIK